MNPVRNSCVRPVKTAVGARPGQTYSAPRRTGPPGGWFWGRASVDPYDSIQRLDRNRPRERAIKVVELLERDHVSNRERHRRVPTRLEHGDAEPGLAQGLLYRGPLLLGKSGQAIDEPRHQGVE